MRRVGALGRALPLYLVLLAGCAHVRETRSREVLEDESVRLSEIPRPDLSRARVRATLSGRELQLNVVAEARCIVQFAERVTTRERVQREPTPSTLAAEAVLMGLGLAVGVSARRASSGAAVDGGDVIGVIALSGGIGAGVALGIDASRYSNTDVRRTEIVPETEARVAPCKIAGARPVKVELVSTSGRRFSVPLDGFGRGRAVLPDDLWIDDKVDFDVQVDGTVVQRLVLTRPE